MTDQVPIRSAGDENEFRLQPPDCPSREELERALEGPIVISEPPPPPPSNQFSVGDIMLFMVGIAVGLAGGTWMPADVFAGVLGVATLVGLVLVTLHPPQSHLGRLIWASFVAAYFMAVLAAILRPPAQ